MSLEGWQLAEHANQISEAIAAMIKMESMKIANEASKMNGHKPLYDQHDFSNLLLEHGLTYNELIEKKRRF
jgi:hypothetical protein